MSLIELQFAECDNRSYIQSTWNKQDILNINLSFDGLDTKSLEIENQFENYMKIKKIDPYEPDKFIDDLYLFASFLLKYEYLNDNIFTTSWSLSGGIRGNTKLYTITDTIIPSYEHLKDKQFIIKDDTFEHARSLNALYVHKYFALYHDARMNLLCKNLDFSLSKFTVHDIKNKKPLIVKIPKSYYFENFSIEEYIPNIGRFNPKKIYDNIDGFNEKILSIDFLVNDDDACNALNILINYDNPNIIYAIDFDRIYNNTKIRFDSSIYQLISKEYVNMYYENDLYKSTMPNCMKQYLDKKNEHLYNKYLKYKKKYLQLKKIL